MNSSNEIKLTLGEIEPTKERLLRYVKRGASSDDCWMWLGSLLPRGYARFSLHNEAVGAHRVSYRVHIGEVPAGMCICHRCDNPPCVNPAHLFLGTNKDNIQDALTKKRMRFIRGEAHPMSKLTCQSVKQIRSEYKPGMSIQECVTIGAKFGVGINGVMSVVRGRTWKHVP